MRCFISNTVHFLAQFAGYYGFELPLVMQSSVRANLVVVVAVVAVVAVVVVVYNAT